MDKHPIQGVVEILLVASCYRNWSNRWPDGPLGTYTGFFPSERVLVQIVSDENVLTFMQMNAQVTYTFILIVSYKVSFCLRCKSNDFGSGHSSELA